MNICLALQDQIFFFFFSVNVQIINLLIMNGNYHNLEKIYPEFGGDVKSFIIHVMPYNIS